MYVVDDAPVLSLSIVVPVHNGEKYIADTVKRILKMADISFEVLLVDDGSVDKSAAICKELASQNAGIRYVYQENAGVAAARNSGIELALGKYICFLDQDDIFLTDGMADLLSRVQSENAQMGMCSTVRMMSPEYGRGAACHADIPDAGADGGMSPYEVLHDAVYRDQDVRDRLLYPMLFRGYDYPFAESKDYFYGSVWKCIFEKEFIRENGIRFERFVNYEDDWIFVTHALSTANCVVTSAKNGYCWCVNRNSESHKMHYISDLTERFDRLDEYVSSYIYRCMNDQEVRRLYRQVSFCDHYVELIRNDTGQRAYRDSVKRYLEKTDHKANLDARRHLKHSAHRKKLILVIFSIAGIRIAYIISKVYDVLERKLETVSWIARLERKRKMNS